MAKLLLIILAVGAVAESLSPKQPPLLIDSPQQAQAAPGATPLDAAD